MPDPVATPQGATITELRKAFPKHPDFVLTQLEKAATLEQAESAFKDVQLAEKDAEIAALKSAKPAPAPIAAPKVAPKAGPAPTEFDGEQTEDLNAGKGFMQLSREYASANKCTLTTAMEKTALAHPDIHEAYVAECRASKPRKIERPKIMGA